MTSSRETLASLSRDDLYDFFLSRLPPGLSPYRYSFGLSCYGYARLMAEELGRRARIYEMVGKKFASWSGETDRFRHAYVVPDDANDGDIALNHGYPEHFDERAGAIRRNGTDVTDWVMSRTWEELSFG